MFSPKFNVTVGRIPVLPLPEINTKIEFFITFADIELRQQASSLTSAGAISTVESELGGSSAQKIVSNNIPVYVANQTTSDLVADVNLTKNSTNEVKSATMYISLINKVNKQHLSISGLIKDLDKQSDTFAMVNEASNTSALGKIVKITNYPATNSTPHTIKLEADCTIVSYDGGQDYGCV